MFDSLLKSTQTNLVGEIYKYHNKSFVIPRRNKLTQIHNGTGQTPRVREREIKQHLEDVLGIKPNEIKYEQFRVRVFDLDDTFVFDALQIIGYLRLLKYNTKIHSPLMRKFTRFYYESPQKVKARFPDSYIKDLTNDGEEVALNRLYVALTGYPPYFGMRKSNDKPLLIKEKFFKKITHPEVDDRSIIYFPTIDLTMGYIDDLIDELTISDSAYKVLKLYMDKLKRLHESRNSNTHNNSVYLDSAQIVDLELIEKKFTNTYKIKYQDQEFFIRYNKFDFIESTFNDPTYVRRLDNPNDNGLVPALNFKDFRLVTGDVYDNKEIKVGKTLNCVHDILSTGKVEDFCKLITILSSDKASYFPVLNKADNLFSRFFIRENFTAEVNPSTVFKNLGSLYSPVDNKQIDPELQLRQSLDVLGIIYKANNLLKTHKLPILVYKEKEYLVVHTKNRLEVKKLKHKNIDFGKNTNFDKLYTLCFQAVTLSDPHKELFIDALLRLIELYTTKSYTPYQRDLYITLTSELTRILFTQIEN